MHPTAEPGDASPLVDVATLWSRLGDPALRIIDARHDLADPEAGRRAHAAARVPGAVHARLDDDLADPSRPAIEGRHPLPDAARFAATLARWGITPATPVVVYDGGSGAMAAARAWWLIRWMGHPDVRVLDGGWAAWQAAGAPVASGPPADGGVVAPAPGAIGAGWHPGALPVATASDVAAPGPGRVLVDARAPERFRGEVEPLDPKAGHIPGARNRPFTDNLAAGRFKPPDVLRREWLALVPEGGRAVLYCGSGVTACHHALAIAQAGLPTPALFAPSWSGWVSDPARPVQSGP